MRLRPSPIFDSIAKSKGHRLRLGFTLIEFLVVVTILAIVVAMMLPVTRTARGPMRTAQCMNHLRQVGLALYNYHDAFGSFPPPYTVDSDGRRLHSWRTLILPFLEQRELYESIDLTKPWDDPVNAEALATSIEIFRCWASDSLEPNYTKYLAIVGEESAFHPDRARDFSEFSSSIATTVMLVEVATADAVPWMQPTDVDSQYLANLSDDPDVERGHGTHVMRADNVIRIISQETPLEERMALSTISAED